MYTVTVTQIARAIFIPIAHSYHPQPLTPLSRTPSHRDTHSSPHSELIFSAPSHSRLHHSHYHIFSLHRDHRHQFQAHRLRAIEIPLTTSPFYRIYTHLIPPRYTFLLHPHTHTHTHTHKVSLSLSLISHLSLNSQHMRTLRLRGKSESIATMAASMRSSASTSSMHQSRRRTRAARRTCTRASKRESELNVKREATAQGAAPPAPASVRGMERPDKFGRFGKFGGQYVPETLMAALADLESTYTEVRAHMRDHGTAVILM